MIFFLVDISLFCRYFRVGSPCPNTNILCEKLLFHFMRKLDNLIYFRSNAIFEIALDF